MKLAKIIKADGTGSVCKYNPVDLSTIKDIIDCDTFEAFLFLDGSVMIVDSEAIQKERPLNAVATEMHKARFAGPGFDIHGDVAIIGIQDIADDIGLPVTGVERL